ncbi:hypothetical protein K2Q08_01885 [Patescibacteria group bacterium]|nr:hypothetical protein [Patescibacteria group bacterium]
MAKSFFLGLVALFFTAVLFMFAYQLNMLPASAYPFIQKFLQSFSLTKSTPPSLEKFEGSWTLTFTPTRAQSDIGTCALPSGSLRVHAGKFTGAVGEPGSSMPVNANVTDDGKLTGVIGNNSTSRKGTITANIGNGAGQGTWKDDSECTGTVTFVKEQAVVDPVQGKVVSATTGTLLRDGKKRALVPGMSLYVGDVVEAGDGTVLLGIGIASQTPIDLSPSMTYKVGQ